ncbi:hypothetical protein [Streptomyces sp. NPDC090025]|uniref:preATP grasp domain-containing protein n=1 Tax=Streptomyces sp. NPDC090025 TaxID=3365922 RepID=UPI0038349C2C
MTTRPSRTILSNLNSDTMVENPTERYLRAMAVPTPRMLWEAEPGDCVVMLAPCPARFRDYLADTLGLDLGGIDIVAPPETALVHPLTLVAELGAGDLVTARPVLDAFALDRPVLDFARRTGVRLHPYEAPPADEVLDTVRHVNTKAGIRQVVADLGLPVAAGGFAARRAELVAGVVDFLDAHPAAIVKANRSSTGFGNIVIEAGARRDREDRVNAALAAETDRASGWIYEEFLPLTASPSYEMTAEEHGVTDYYSCDQRTVNNGWTGMITPAADGPSTPVMRKAARTVGEWLHAHGYRGLFDVDFGTFEGGYVVTEANVRTTGGTYLHKLATRLRPGPDPVHWRADGRLGAADGGPDFAEAVRRLTAEGLTDPAGQVRAVLTTDTRETDGKWRYLVVGADAGSVADAEHIVERVLEVP